MTTFTRILQIFFILLGIASFVEPDPLFLFVFFGLGTIIILFALVDYFGFYYGIFSTIVFAAAPIIGIYLYRLIQQPFGEINFTLLSGVQIFETIPVIIPLIIATVLGSSLFFTHYIIMPKIRSAYFDFTWALLNTIPVLIFALIAYPALAAKNFVYWTPAGIYYNVPLPIFIFPVILSFIFISFVLKFADLKEKTIDISFAKLASLSYVIVIVYFGVIALQTKLFIPFILSLALLIYYLIQKYNFVKASQNISSIKSPRQ